MYLVTLAASSTKNRFKHAHGGFPGSFWETYSAFANTNQFAQPKSDLQVFNSDNHSIKINYSKLVGDLIGHHLQVWEGASISLSSLLKDAAVLLSELFISEMPAKNLFEVLEIDTMYKFKNNLIIPLNPFCGFKGF